MLLVVTSRHGAGPDGAVRQRLYVNLRAPLVLDTVRRTAVQHVLASPAYPVRHCLAAAADRTPDDAVVAPAQPRCVARRRSSGMRRRPCCAIAARSTK